jgi:hypothetical protein
MQRLEVSGAVRPLYGSLGVKGLTIWRRNYFFFILAHSVYKIVKNIGTKYVRIMKQTAF